MTNSQHIINKKKFQVKHYGKANAFMLQTGAEQFCKVHLLPAVDALLSTYNDTEETIYVDRLTIEVTGNSLQDLNAGLAGKIISEIKNQLINQAPIKSADENSVGQQHALFLFYIKNGYLQASQLFPSGGVLPLFSSWLHQQDTPNDELIQLLSTNPNAAPRMAGLIAPGQWWPTLARLTSQSAALQKLLEQELASLQTKIIETQWQQFMLLLQQAILQTLSTNFSAEAIMASAARLLMSNPLFTKPLQVACLQASVSNGTIQQMLTPSLQKKTVINQNSIATDEIVQPIFAANAGLIIAAVYVPRLLSNLQLDPHNIIHQPASLAVLHYLCSGPGQAEDWQLVLPKILLGLPVSYHYQLPLLTAGQMCAADDLLLAIVTNWTVLKNTSIPALQQTFLQRSGTLMQQDNAWQLTVIPETFDLLLDHLPWQINLVKLPWMQQMLQVYWR